MSSISFSATSPPDFVDEEERLTRDVVTLRVAWQTLDPEAQFRIKEKLVTEFYITNVFLDEVYEHLCGKFSTRDSDEWRGEHCQDCGELYGVGVVHTCPSDAVGFAGSQYVNIGR